ncbi:MFS transporter [Salipiger abyssi]|uniref:Arabinose efflux permease family protein n=1 Tax=Salipiger abyssi TaxID=1250539 RepID=A0A1P8UXG6_9RHOB|nr:MFS transporter [Salipiger abyssi]APZ54081.1 arabinose efflux permease family protein [Salipiger abyssi]
MGLKRDLLASRAPAAAFAAMGLYWGGFAALVPDLKPQARMSDEAFGLAMLIAAVGAVMAMWLAPLAERRLGRRALPVLMLLMIATFLLPGVSYDWLGFTVAMTLAAGAVGVLDVVMNAQVSAIEQSHGRSLMNLNHGIYSLVYAASAVGTGLAREAGAGPLTVFSCLAAIALGLTVVSFRAPLLTPGDSPDAGGRAPRWALILPGGVVILIGFLAEQATEGWSALYLERNLGAGAAAGSIGPALLGLTMGAGRLFAQSLAQRFSEPSVIRAGAAIAALGAALAAFAPALWLAYAGFAILGLGGSVIVPMAFAFVGARVAADRRAQAISRLSVIGYAGFFLGPPMMGGLSGQFGLNAAFAAVALILALIPLALVPLMRRTLRP